MVAVTAGTGIEIFTALHNEGFARFIFFHHHEGGWRFDGGDFLLVAASSVSVAFNCGFLFENSVNCLPPAESVWSFEDGGDVVGKIDRARITVHGREARAGYCAATAVGLGDGKLKGCTGLEGQRFRQFVNGSGVFRIRD